MTKTELIAHLEHLSRSSQHPHDSPQSDTQQSALHDSELRIRAILETAVEGIITIDERGAIESVNRAAEKIFGYQEEEMIGRNVSILMPAPFRSQHDAYIDNYLQSGHAKIIGIGREVVGQRKDGTVFPMDLAVSEVRLANQRLFTGFVRDITDRKRAEQRQELQYAVGRVLTESKSIGEGVSKVIKTIGEVAGWNSGEFWAVDREAKVIHHVESWSVSNELASEFEIAVGRTTCAIGEGLPGRVWQSGKPEWLADLAQNRFALGTKMGQHETSGSTVAFPITLGSEMLGVMVFFSKSKQELDAEWLALSTSLGNQLGQFIERKRAESKLAELARTLSEKNKELETIVYVASHDLRSPLVNIQGFSKELVSSCEELRKTLQKSAEKFALSTEVVRILEEEIPEAVDFILSGVSKIDALLSGFLRFSRLGRAAIRIERIDMAALLANIIRTMDFQIKQSGASIKIGPLPSCLGDLTQINQVFSNLVDNSLKYLDPRRPGVITVSGQTENGRAVFAVQDNGIGIAPEHQSKIFEIFHRLNPGTGEGEGLGLTIAQRILERQNGRIWVQSTGNSGSTFFVSLPT